MILFGWLNPLSWGSTPARRRALYWTAHVLVVVVVVILLGIVNHTGGLDRVLRTRWLGLYRVWLPLLFLLGYTLFWLIRWLYWLLGPEGPGAFDDIEDAWTKARGQLEAAGIVLTETPLFLVLGRPGGSLESLFAATRMPFQVRHAPRDEPAPLHVYASREAIFVTCEGASLLPVQAARLSEALLPLPAAGPAPLTDLLDQGSGVRGQESGGGDTSSPAPGPSAL